MTTTSAVPVVPADVVAVTDWSVFTVKLVAGTPPKVTAVAPVKPVPVKPVPVIATDVPPAAEYTEK
jgi:hypothetical protein